MTRWRLAFIVSLTGAALVDVPAARQTPTFRGRASVVSVDVSVQRRGRPVTGLQAADFVLQDNGVPQTVTAVPIDRVPIDASLVVDVSGSTAGSLEGFRRDIVDIASLLRPTDRLRLITFSSTVEEVFPFQAGDLPPPVDLVKAGGMTSVNDAVVLALLQRPVLDRRHLVVVFTDGLDNLSVLAAARLRDVAARADGLLHLVWAGSPSGGMSPSRPMPVTGIQENARAALEAAAEATGGRAQGSGLFRRSLVTPFERILAEFRSSYLLTYSPRDVPADGWHVIDVDVATERGLSIRFRRGYFGG